MLTSHIIRVAVEAALAEDAPYGDITCETTIPADETGSAHLTARENGVMSGIDVFAAAFAAQNPAVTVTAAIKDGERFQRGQILATVKGPVRDLLTAERIALNFTQRMSGIATMTAAFVDAVNAIYGDDYDGPVTRPWPNRRHGCTNGSVSKSCAFPWMRKHISISTHLNASSTARPVNVPRWSPPCWPTTRSAPWNPWRNWSASPTRTACPSM